MASTMLSVCSDTHAEDPARVEFAQASVKPTLVTIDQQSAALDHFIVEDGVAYAGQHLVFDFWGASQLDNLALLEQAFRDCVDACGATLLHLHLHHFTPTGGISGVAVLAESHISVHTWPEINYAAFDVFMCGDARPHEAIPVLQRAFAPAQIELKTLKRGQIGD